MFQLFYVSDATVKFDREMLRGLLVKARDKNAKLGITGMLLYRGACFAQILEGEEILVRSLYEEISRDPRHHKITVMFEGPAREREFHDWSMAFREPSGEFAAIPGFSDFLNPARQDAGSKKDVFPPTSHHLLETFKRALESVPEDL